MPVVCGPDRPSRGACLGDESVAVAVAVRVDRPVHAPPGRLGVDERIGQVEERDLQCLRYLAEVGLLGAMGRDGG